MKYKLSKETRSRIIWDIIIFGTALFISQQLISNKIEAIFNINELKKGSQITEKIDIYYEALTIVNKYLASQEWKGEDNLPPLKLRNTGTTQPTEMEINNCFSKLCLYTENKEILLLYLDFFDKRRNDNPTTVKLANFTSLLRKDLGYENSFLDPKKDEYKWIFIINNTLPFSDVEKYLKR